MALLGACARSNDDLEALEAQVSELERQLAEQEEDESNESVPDGVDLRAKAARKWAREKHTREAEEVEGEDSATAPQPSESEAAPEPASESGDVPAPDPAPEPEPQPSPKPEPDTSPSTVDARGTPLPNGMILPEAYDFAYSCEWSNSTLVFDFVISLRGGKQYIALAVRPQSGENEGDDGIGWRYFSQSPDSKTIEGRVVDRKPESRNSLVLPPQDEWRFQHYDESGPHPDHDYWLDIDHVRQTVDYNRLTCSGRDPR